MSRSDSRSDDRVAAEMAYLAACCPAFLASIADPVTHLRDLERSWRERACSLVDQLTVPSPRWRDRPDIEGWPAPTAERHQLIDAVVDELADVWRPQSESPSAVAEPLIDNEYPTESDRWEWVLTHVGLAQETGRPLSDFLGPAYLSMWERIVAEHPHLAGLYRPDI